MELTVDKYNNPALDDPDRTRMVGQADLDLALSVAARLPEDATIVEFGPWLGGVTRHLAAHGNVHVVDRFLWTEQNDERLPGLHAAGEDFRPLFEHLMAQAGVEVTIHAAPINGFTWPGGPIHYVFVDVPRGAPALLDCLRAVAADLRPGAPVLVKHGANPVHHEMIALIHHLLTEGFFTLDRVGQPAWCNIAVLRATTRTSELAALDWSPELLLGVPGSWTVPDPWGGAIYAAARLAVAAEAADWPLAHAMLDGMPPDRRMLEAWDQQESLLTVPEGESDAMQRFSDLVALHHDPRGHEGTDLDDLARSVPAAIRGAWLRMADKPWRGSSFDSAAIAHAAEMGAMQTLARLGPDPRGRNVVAVGEDMAAFGVAVMAAGAASFLGLNIGGAPRGDSGFTRIGPSALAPFRSAELYLGEEFDLAYLPDLATQPEARHPRITAFREQLPASCEVITYGPPPEPSSAA